MNKVNIYLSGGTEGLTIEEQIKWRNQIIDAVKYGDCDLEPTKTPVFFSPPDYHLLSAYKTEKEAMDFELNRLRKSDLVVVNFNTPQSIKMAMEMATAKENRIPIIGLNKDNVELHPWLNECCIRICDNVKELVDQLVYIYLN